VDKKKDEGRRTKEWELLERGKCDNAFNELDLEVTCACLPDTLIHSGGYFFPHLFTLVYTPRTRSHCEGNPVE
jgi:hypothetical protein